MANLVNGSWRGTASPGGAGQPVPGTPGAAPLPLSPAATIPPAAPITPAPLTPTPIPPANYDNSGTTIPGFRFTPPRTGVMPWNPASAVDGRVGEMGIRPNYFAGPMSETMAGEGPNARERLTTALMNRGRPITRGIGRY